MADDDALDDYDRMQYLLDATFPWLEYQPIGTTSPDAHIRFGGFQNGDEVDEIARELRQRGGTINEITADFSARAQWDRAQEEGLNWTPLLQFIGTTGKILYIKFTPPTRSPLFPLFRD